MKRFAALLLSIILLAACEPPGFYNNPGNVRPADETVTPVITQAVTQQPTLIVDEPVNAVSVSWSINAPVVKNSLKAGSVAEVTLRFTPTSIQTAHFGDGIVDHIISSGWTDHPVSRMRYCLSAVEPCADPGEARPFEAESSTTLNLDWLGERQVYLAVEFLDKDGNSVPVVRDAELQTLSTSVLMLNQGIFTAVDTQITDDTLPASIQTAVAATQTAFPVTGSIKIENSPCCKGGPAGKPVNVRVNFQASSPFGKVTEMRLGTTCPYNPSNISGDWEPYVEEKTFSAAVPLNWSSFTRNVQYRDEKGNLSEIYCDNLGIEGSPEQPQ